MYTNIRALIIGPGTVGERHARAQKRLGVDTAVFDANKFTAERVAKLYNIQQFLDLNKALEWATLVHICTPDDLHTDIAAKAIKLGKDILCEKPLTTSLKDAQLLLDLVKQYKTKFFVANNYRLTPTFGEIQKRVKRGTLGRILSIETTYLHDMRKYHKKTPWRLRQDFLYGGGVHAIDLACWIVNEPVKKVIAQTGIKVMENYKMPEDYRMILTFRSDLTAHVWASARVVLPVHKTDLQVYCERGVYFADNKSGTLKSFKQSQKDNKYTTEAFNAGYRQTIPKEIQIVDNYLIGKRSTHFPLPDIHEAVKIIEVVDAVERSIKTGKEIVL